jgi:ribose transport system substrate-binding protein
MNAVARVIAGIALVAGLAVPAAQANAAPITVGFTTITLADRFFVRLQDGMDAGARKYGVTMLYNNPDGSPDAQVKAIEDFITQKVGAIIVDALDPNGVQPALRDAQAAGIPVIAVDEVLDGFATVTAGVGLDNLQLGRDIAERMLAYADAHGIDRLVIGDVHTLDAPIENTRSRGFASFVAEHADRMKIVGAVDAKFSTDAAAAGAENLMTANPDLNFFFCSGGLYLVGALAAVRSQGAADRVKLAGLDFMAQLVKAFEDGTYVVAAETNPEMMGDKAVEVAALLAKGGKPATRDSTIPVRFHSLADLPDLKARFSE